MIKYWTVGLGFGSNTSGQVGNYQNVFSSSNVPVARNGAISWSDSKTFYGYLDYSYEQSKMTSLKIK